MYCKRSDGEPVVRLSKPGSQAKLKAALGARAPAGIESMTSPPPTPGSGPIDLKHLERMTLGDPGLTREVLGMFARQAGQLAATLAGWPPEAAALAHTLKGSARAIGAGRVAEAAGALEAALRDGHRSEPMLGELRDAVTEADAAIARLLQGA